LRAAAVFFAAGFLAVVFLAAVRRAPVPLVVAIPFLPKLVLRHAAG